MLNTKENKDLWNSFNSMFQSAFAREMKTDISETEDEYILDIEVPGMDKKNISISFLDGSLVVETAMEPSKDKKNYLAKERTSLNMSRSYYLEDADEEHITAKMENGVLTLHVAKIKNIPNPKKVIEIE